MKQIFFDWNKQYVNVLVDDEETDTKYPSLFHMLDAIGHEPAVIIGEATFESFRRAERQRFIEECAKRGHTLLTTPTRETGRRWNELGYDREGKNDSIAVQVIRTIATDGITHLKVPQAYPDDVWVKTREAANYELMLLRSEFRFATGPRGGLKFISAKDDFADELIKSLPPYHALDEITQIALGDGKVYNKTVVAAVGVAARHVHSTREFDKLAGLYHHGYPSQIRSDLHHWRWRFLRKMDNPISLTEYRRSLRWLFHQFNQA